MCSNTGMTKSLGRRFLTLAAALAVVPWASAHPGHDGDHDFNWDFSGGLVHPLSGLDHLLAMIAVGLWAAQLGGRARWLVPAAFVGVMALGAALGHAGMNFSGMEQAIAASVLVLGLLVARSVRLPVAAGMALVGVFALFHGLARKESRNTLAGASPPPACCSWWRKARLQFARIAREAGKPGGEGLAHRAESAAQTHGIARNQLDAPDTAPQRADADP